MKNKEIEELLNYLKDDNEYYTEEEEVLVNCGELILEKEDVDLLLSYIEQLEADYKETNDSITWWTNRFNAVERDNRNYKSRIDKAIEYINKHFHWGLSGNENFEELLNILKGDSDE